MALMVVGLLFFAAMVLVVAFGYRETERRRSAQAAEEPEAQRRRFPPVAATCRTVEEAVFDIEHRIDADRREVAAILGRAAEDGTAAAPPDLSGPWEAWRR